MMCVKGHVVMSKVINYMVPGTGKRSLISLRGVPGEAVEGQIAGPLMTLAKVYISTGAEYL